MTFIRMISVASLLALAFPLEATAAAPGQAVLMQVVLQARSSVTISAVNTVLSQGQTLSLIATVHGVKSFVPTGKIQFNASSLSSSDSFSSPILPVPADGIVEWSTLLPANEQYAIMAIYDGDRNFTGSISSPPLIVGPEPQSGGPNFLLMGPSSLTIQSGETVPAVLTLQPINGFAGTVSLSCSTNSNSVGCLITQKALDLGGASSSDVPISLSFSVLILGFATTTASTSAFLFFGIATLMRRRRYPAWIFAGTLALLASLAGCGGGINFAARQGAPLGSYQVTITATSGPLTHSQTVTVNVAP